MSFSNDISIILNAFLFLSILIALIIQWRKRSNHFLAFFCLGLLNTGLRVLYLGFGMHLDGLGMDDSVLLIQVVNAAFIFVCFRMIHSMRQENYTGKSIVEMFLK